MKRLIQKNVSGKRKGKERLTGAVLAALLITLTGCGAAEKENLPAQAATEGPLGAYEETLTCTVGRKTIANPKFPEGDTYEDNAYTRYAKEILNIQIKDEFEANGEDYDRQVSLAIASGELPDIMGISSQDLLDELVENNLVEDLTDVYQQYASDEIKKIHESYDGRCMEFVTYDGRMMAMPGTNLDSAPCVTYVRKDWLDKLELNVDPDGDKCISVEDLEHIARAFMENDLDGSGNPVGIAFAPYLTADDYGGSGYTMNAIGSAFSAFPKNWLLDENGQVYYGSTAPEMKAALELLAGWFQQGVLDPQFGTRTWDDITALLTNGQTGITFGPWHLPDWLLNNVRSMNPEADFEAFAIADEKGLVNVTHSKASTNYIVVRKGYSNPEAVVKLVNLYFDEMVNAADMQKEHPEVAAYIELGVDGSARPVNMEVNAYTSLMDDYAEIKACVEGKIPLEQVRTVESRQVVESVKRYLENKEQAEVADWSRYISRMEGIELIESLTMEKKFNWVSPAFYGITETMKTNNANLGALEEEVFVAIITGAKGIDQFDVFVNDWKQRGGEQITREVQNALSGEED